MRRNLAVGAALRRFWDAPRPWRWAALVALLVGLPALGGGLIADDHLLRANLGRDPRWTPLQTAPWDAFHFYPQRVRREEGIDQGLGPWWGHPEMHARFFRPLTSLTHFVEFQRVPDAPWVMHLTSLVWYALLAAVAAALYRRFLPGWAAGLAALLYAVDWTHGVPMAWIANRNATISGCFGLSALLLQLRGRQILAPLALALGLASGESALGAAAYLLAFAICLDEGRLGTRLLRLGPFLIVLAAWLVVWKAGGYGVRGSSLYLDPSARPLEFLWALPVRMLLQVACELGAPGPEGWLVFPTAWRLAMLAIAFAVVALAVLALAPLLRRDRTVRFFALGAVLSVVPICGTFPSSRLMLIPGFGLIGLCARAFVGWREREPWVPAGRLRRAPIAAFAVLACAVRLAVTPPLLLFNQRQFRIVEDVVSGLNDGLSRLPALAGAHLVLLDAPDFIFTMYLLAQRSTRGLVLPRSAFLVGLATHRLEVERPDEGTVIVRDPRGFYGESFSALVRPADAPMIVGTRVELPSALVEVLSVDAHGVTTAVAIHPRLPLTWVVWDGATYVPFALPAPGDRAVVPARPNPLMEVLVRQRRE